MTTQRTRRLLRRALGARRRDVVAASLLFTGHQLGEALVPVIVGFAVAHAIEPGGAARIALWLLVLAADFAFLSSCYRFGARAAVRARQGAAHAARMLLTQRAVAPGGGVDLAPGEALSRASSDATRVGAFAGLLASAIAAVTALLVATALLLAYSPLLAAVILVGTVALILAQQFVSGTQRRRSGVERQQAADATALAEDLVRGLRVLSGIGAQSVATTRYRGASGSALRSALWSVRAEATLAAAGTVITGAYLAIIAATGGWLALTGRIGLGQFVSALGLSQFILGPMEVVAGISAAHARARASAARIEEVLDLPPAVPSDVVQAPVIGGLDVVLDGVDVAGREVSLRAREGELTGVVVDDPVVATAMVALLAREFDPVEGTVMVGGVALDEWPLDELRATVLVAAHDAVLLGSTVAEAVAVRGADTATIERATHAAFADQVLDVLSDGADTELGDGGQNLSGGQRQRLALARALAADAPVLVLHDPTTAVDAATEDGIAARLCALRAGRTTVLITASPTLLARCDRVVHVVTR